MAFIEKYVTVTGGGLHDGSSEANAWTFDEAVANVSAGDRVNVKVGNHTCTAASTVNGTYASPIAVRGYQTTIGDLDNVKLSGLVAGTDMPKVDVTSGSNRGFIGQYFSISHISYHGNLNYQSITRIGDNSYARACRFVNTNSSAYGACGAGRSVLHDCYFETNSGTAVLSGGHHTIASYCVFKATGSGANGLKGGAARGCIFDGWTSKAIEMSYPDPVDVSNCTFVNCAVGVQVTISYGNPIAILGCYFDTCTTAINNAASTGYFMVDGCCYRNVTTELSGVDSQSNRKTDASDSFVDSAANDYTLTSSSAGYAATNPTAFAEFGTFNARDIGAIQHANPSLGVVLNAKHPIG